MPPERRYVIRAGTGYDSHRIDSGGRMLLGGVEVAKGMHLVAHSDGDAIAHALTDAILGAAAAGDIGEMFPDTDPANRDGNSMDMLVAAVARVRQRGFVIVNADVTVITERPKLSPHRDAIRASLAAALQVDPEAVSVKGKSNEGMGWIGRGEGLACMAVATIASDISTGAD